MSGFTSPYTHAQRTTATMCAFSHVKVLKTVVLLVGLIINGRLATETRRWRRAKLQLATRESRTLNVAHRNVRTYYSTTEEV